MPPREPSLSASTDYTDEPLELLENINNRAVFYPGRQHGKHLDLLVHLSRYSNLLLTVTGPTGSGKTHLKNKLREQLDSGVTAVSLDARKSSQGPQLLSTLESILRLDIPPGADTRMYLEEIRDYTQNLSEDGRSCLLLIDNAQALDQSALDLLLELATTDNDNRRPHLALFGREELLKCLNDRANQPRFEAVGHQLPLEAFSEVEARGYLEHRCASVGLDHLPLNDQQFKRVYQASRGWPGLLNSALVQELQEADRVQELVTEEPEEAEEMPKTLAKKTPKKAAKNIKKGAFTLQDLQKKLAKTPLLPLAIGALLLALLIVLFLYSGRSEDTSEPSSTTTGLISRSHELREGTQPEGPVRERENRLEQLEREVQQLPPLEEELPEPQPEPVEPPAPLDSLDAAPPPDREVATPTPEPPHPPPPAASSAGQAFRDQGNRREAWLMARNPQNFTLQVLASAEESTVTGFIAEQDHPGRFSYYRRNHANSPWVLVYGDYPNRPAAEAARDNLPAGLRNQQPWLRSFQGIQNDLENR